MDAFSATWWNQAQAFAWVLLRDKTTVRNARSSQSMGGGFSADDMTFDIHAALRESRGVRGSEYKSYSEAEVALLEELQAGRITAVGVKDGQGTPHAVPAVEWLVLRFGWRPQRVESHHSIQGSKWSEVSFRRDQILAKWPDPYPEATGIKVAWNFVPPEHAPLQIAVARAGERIFGAQWIATEAWLQNDEQERSRSYNLSRSTAILKTKSAEAESNPAIVTEFGARSKAEMSADFDQLIYLLRETEYIRQEHGKSYEEIRAITWGQRIALSSSTRETAAEWLAWEDAETRRILFHEAHSILKPEYPHPEWPRLQPKDYDDIQDSFDSQHREEIAAWNRVSYTIDQLRTLLYTDRIRAVVVESDGRMTEIAPNFWATGIIPDLVFQIGAVYGQTDFQTGAFQISPNHPTKRGSSVPSTGPRSVFVPEKALRLLLVEMNQDVVSSSPSLPSEEVGKSETQRKGGRPPKYDWDGFWCELVSRAQTPDGLPTRDDGTVDTAKLFREMLDWCNRVWGEEPAESQVRAKLSLLSKKSAA